MANTTKPYLKIRGLRLLEANPHFSSGAIVWPILDLFPVNFFSCILFLIHNLQRLLTVIYIMTLVYTIQESDFCNSIK